jgi:hypothetical protein
MKLQYEAAAALPANKKKMDTYLNVQTCLLCSQLHGNNVGPGSWLTHRQSSDVLARDKLGNEHIDEAELWGDTCSSDLHFRYGRFDSRRGWSEPL